MKIPQFDSSVSFDSPVGNINVYARGESVVFLNMGEAPCEATGRAKVLGIAKKQLTDYFKGKSKVLDFAVELHGTAFQEAVWQQIAALGWGQTASYADIANAIGNPKAVRAVGGAVGANPVPLVVGCHLPAIKRCSSGYRLKVFRLGCLGSPSSSGAKVFAKHFTALICSAFRQ